jgi:hypothetical protein
MRKLWQCEMGPLAEGFGGDWILFLVVRVVASGIAKIICMVTGVVNSEGVLSGPVLVIVRYSQVIFGVEEPSAAVRSVIARDPL